MPEATALAQALAVIVGRENCLLPAELPLYSVDGLTPQAAVFVQSVEQVAEILRLATREGLAVTVRGGGTAMRQGYAPSRLDVVLLTRKLDRVLEHEPAEMTATVQAGVTLGALNAALAKHGQVLPLDAPASSRATVGGVLAANTSGPHRAGYRTARDRLIGIQVVDAAGTAVRAGGKVVKNVAGYDLQKAFIGSLGTLGVIVEATFKLSPLPPARFTMVGAFPELPEALAVAHNLLATGLRPTALDLLNARAYTSVCNRTGNPTMSDRRYVLAAELAGTAAAVRRMASQTHRAITDGGGKSHPIEEEMAQAEFWRALVDTGVDMAQPASMTTRCGVLWAGLPSLVHGFEAIAEGSQLEVGLDVHLTAGVMRGWWWPEGGGVPKDDGLLAEAVGTLRKAAGNHSGYLVVESCSPGVKRKADVWGQAGPELAIMRNLKQQFDPQGVLSPGRFVGGL